MGKKMKLPFPFNSKETIPSWPWPSCTNPRTLSFRAGPHDPLKTMSSAYHDTTIIELVDTSPESCFTSSSDSRSFSSASGDSGGGESIEMVIRGLRSERLFFRPGESNSILEEAKTDGLSFKESVVMSMESLDPFLDFKGSMEEMVEAHGLKDLEDLEELLSCYLRVNGKNNHGYIVAAFVDLLVGLAFASSSSSSSSSNDHHSSAVAISHSTSPLSFSSSSSSTTPSSSLLEEAEVEIEKTEDSCSSFSSDV